VDISDSVDNAINNTTSKLIAAKDLVYKRQLLINVEAITYAPLFIDNNDPDDDDARDELDYIGLAVNQEDLKRRLGHIEWDNGELYEKLLSEIQAVSSLGRGKNRADLKIENSRGSKLKKLENSISTLDQCQSKAVIETVTGVQRIRGLAGSGKTIVLARKIAYLHSLNPDWNIAVTFQTRSLKDQLERLVTIFCIEQAKQEPDWDKINILQAWGGTRTSGIYYQACIANNVTYFDLDDAKKSAPHMADKFDFVCSTFLKNATNIAPAYDLILVDEAQDFSPSFLNICYKLLTDEKRLVYAYDELQNLNDNSMKSPEDIWGSDENGEPVVSLRSGEGEAEKDIILGTCYRNPGPVLATAHALGFGIHHTPIVQMFDSPELWKAIGYENIKGELADNTRVVMARTIESSPKFLHEHSDIEDIIQFNSFEGVIEQADWIANQIIKNLKEDELKPSDIMVIHPDPFNAKSGFGPVRKRLFDAGIISSIAGVTSSPDEFISDGSVTFTSIYRAKGNEAAMVYVMSAEYCNSYPNLHQKRNTLFTAMTRTKAWVRVSGVGPNFISLSQEYEQVKNNDFTLDFTYPDEEARKT
jgi:superfamily I DNA and RNA helicase